MKRRRLFWKIYPYYFVIIVVALTLTAVYGSREMKTMHAAQVTSTLEARARMAARNIGSLMLAGDVSGLDQECKEIGFLYSKRNDEKNRFSKQRSNNKTAHVQRNKIRKNSK